VLADESLREGRYVVGANREGYHLTGVAPGKDFPCEFVDLQVALPGRDVLAAASRWRWSG
jgi:prolyl-tRNA synthetase